MHRVLLFVVQFLRSLRPTITVEVSGASFEYEGPKNTVAEDKKELLLPCGLPKKVDKDIITSTLKKQSLLRGMNSSFFDAVFALCRVDEYRKGDVLARQGDDGDEIFFIFDGRISVEVNGHIVDTSGPDECVGEMMLTDLMQRRSATLCAEVDVRVCVINVHELEKTASRFGLKECLYANLSSILSKRLRSRQSAYFCVNTRPRIFIGSTSESVTWAERVKKALPTLVACDVICWSDDDVFAPSRSTMSSLEKTVSRCDFAVLLLDKVDKLDFRDQENMDVPRDNMIFELGYCMAKVGRGRTFFLVDSAKLPSDVDGLTYYRFKKSTRCVNKITERIAGQISKMGVKK